MGKEKKKNLTPAGMCQNTNTIFIIPQFRSIIPCEVLLYIEVTFLGFIH